MAPDQDDDTGFPAQEAVRLRLHAQVECLLPAAPGGRGLCVPDDANTGVIAHRMPPVIPWPTRARVTRHRL
jgi:hypothetical protein